MHECIIGMRHNYEATDIVTLKELKDHIQRDKEYRSPCFKWRSYELSDYCDKRKNTDLTRFEYCPMCGKKIDWKAIKKYAINPQSKDELIKEGVGDSDA